MGIFANNSSIKVYEAKWNQIGEPQDFDAEDLAMIKPVAEVVKSTYGTSMRFDLVQGGKMFIPISSTEDLMIGTKVEVKVIQVIVLQKEGSNDTINRVIIKKEQPVVEELPATFTL